MPHKRVLRPERLRQVPPQFSWIDQRLVREGHLERCDVQALALYLVLVTVADAKGLSADLIRLDLIGYERPLYQVLSLDPPASPRRPGMHSVEHGLAQLRATLDVPADRDRHG